MKPAAISRAALAAAALFAAAVSCKSSVDPNGGRFSCASDADCGQGFVCRPQASGGSLCFKAGECDAPETCNGLDDDCNGLVDETFPEKDASCVTGLAGVCGPGKQTCTEGQLACAALVQPSAEICDTLDNNCNGAVDEGFDLTTDSRHCGACGVACAPGAGCAASSCHETDCSDGVDNDHNGLTDCEDPACASRACDLADPQLNCGHGFPVADAGADGDADGGDAGADAGDTGPDAGSADGGDAGPDAGSADGVDAGEPDAGRADAGDGGLEDAGELDGGPADGGGSDAGAPPQACVPRESDCANGADDDLDGLTDCADDDCDGRECRVGAVCANRLCPPPG